MRKKLTVVTILFLFVSLSSLVFAAEPIRIGYIGPLTGSVGSDPGGRTDQCCWGAVGKADQSICGG
jgi:hypothetical protein